MHALIIMESQNYYNLLLYQWWSWVLKLRSELHDFIGAGIEFQRDAPELLLLIYFNVGFTEVVPIAPESEKH